MELMANLGNPDWEFQVILAPMVSTEPTELKENQAKTQRLDHLESQELKVQQEPLEQVELRVLWDLQVLLGHKESLVNQEKRAPRVHLELTVNKEIPAIMDHKEKKEQLESSVKTEILWLLLIPSPVN